MSRCFPFPPPGFEKKARTDEVDLIKKEQHKERKHKKEREEKEKKDSREKHDKEGRDGKHKEKKDKREKHGDKKKDKDKDREKYKNKNSIANEKGFPAEGVNVVRPDQKEIKHKDKQSDFFEKRSVKQYDGHNGEKPWENNHLAEENRDSKFLQELGKRIKDEDGVTRNQLAQKFTVTNHRMDEEAVILVGRGGSICLDGKERLKDKITDSRKSEVPGIQAVSRPSGNATVQNHTGNFHPRVEGMPGPLEKNIHRPVENKEKGKEKKDDKQGDKRKDEEKEKKGHGKDKDKDKEKKKEEKQKDPTEHKKMELNKLKENKKGGLGANSLTQVPRGSYNNAVTEEHSKKRKDIESNGILHAKDSLPSKVPRFSSSPHLFPENGRISEPCQIISPYTSDRLGASSDLKVDNKQCKINGIIEAGPSVVTSKKTATATVPAEAVPSAVTSKRTATATVTAEPTAKLPHPDLNYLSQVYSLPKVEEWSGFDDQDWLFGSSCPRERKHVVESSKVGETPQVWAEALHIELADVCVLPYVIPY